MTRPTLPRGAEIERSFGRLLLSALLAAVLLAWFLPGLERQTLEEGEHEYLLFGELSFRLAFLERTADPQRWSRDHYNYGARNPHLAKYLYGAALYLEGGGPEDVGAFPSWRRPGGRWQRVPGTPPSGFAVVAARRVTALLGAGTCLVLLAIGAALGSWPLGLVAALLLASSPAFHPTSRRVLTDVPEAFFATLALLVLLLAVARWRHGRPLALLLGAAACGLACALALSVKMRSLLTIVAVAAVYALGVWLAGRLRREPRAAPTSRAAWILAAALSVGVCAAVFVALNPYLYRQPLRHLGNLLSIGHLEWTLPSEGGLPEKLQPWEHQALDTPALKLEALWRLGFVPPKPSGAERWREASIHPAAPVIVLLIALGLFRTAAGARRELRSGAPPVRVGLLVWVAIAVLGVLVWTPFAWPRYYVYLAPLWALLAAAGLLEVPRALRSAVGALRSRG